MTERPDVGDARRATPAISNFAELDLDSPPSIGRGEARVHAVRRVAATPSRIAGYGRLVRDFASAEVTIVPWPVPGPRPLVPGTGAEGGVVEGTFEMERAGERLWAVNHAVGRRYLTGWFADPADARDDRTPLDTSRLFTYEANYHPDGGQVFFPRQRRPFVALLAKSGDHVTPDDFVAFTFDGSCGLHIDPGVWHQPLFPVGDRLTFDDKQGRVHACVSVSFVAEFGVYLSVPLVP